MFDLLWSLEISQFLSFVRFNKARVFAFLRQRLLTYELLPPSKLNKNIYNIELYRALDVFVRSRGVDTFYILDIMIMKEKRNKMRVTIKGKIYNINKENVEKKLREIQPEEDERAKYFVEIRGKQFPIKQIVSKSLGLLKPAFNTQEAFAILQRLGFKIVKRN